MCQRHTGSLTATWVDVAADAIEWTGPGGFPSLYRSSATSSRAFCAQCGSSIGAVDDSPVIGLLTGVFNTLALHALKPATHSFADQRPDWWNIEVE